MSNRADTVKAQSITANRKPHKVKKMHQNLYTVPSKRSIWSLVINSRAECNIRILVSEWIGHQAPTLYSALYWELGWPQWGRQICDPFCGTAHKTEQIRNHKSGKYYSIGIRWAFLRKWLLSQDSYYPSLLYYCDHDRKKTQGGRHITSYGLQSIIKGSQSKSLKQNFS